MATRFIDMTGQKYNRLTVIERVHTQKAKTMWLCKCDCGNTTIAEGYEIRIGKTKSCGCYNNEHRYLNQYKHGGASKAKTGKKEPLYDVWCEMRRRCLNPNNHAYKNYGGRGIKVCEEWEDYSVFKTWAYMNGYDPKKESRTCTLDRIDVNGNYEPSNCRWVDMKIQGRNTRVNRLIEWRGNQYTVADLADIANINYATLYRRIKLGWNIEDIMTKPVDTRRRKNG